MSIRFNISVAKTIIKIMIKILIVIMIMFYSSVWPVGICNSHLKNNLKLIYDFHKIK